MSFLRGMGLAGLLFLWVYGCAMNVPSERQSVR